MKFVLRKQLGVVSEENLLFTNFPASSLLLTKSQLRGHSIKHITAENIDNFKKYILISMRITYVLIFIRIISNASMLFFIFSIKSKCIKKMILFSISPC